MDHPTKVQLIHRKNGTTPRYINFHAEIVRAMAYDAQAFGPRSAPGRLPAPKWCRKENHRASTQLVIKQLRSAVWPCSIHFSGFVSRPSP